MKFEAHVMTKTTCIEPENGREFVTSTHESELFHLLLEKKLILNKFFLSKKKKI